MKKLLEELFILYYKDVYGYLYGLSRDAALSEDLAQEAFLEAIRSVASFRGEADIKTWLFAIARNRWYSYLRKKHRQVSTGTLNEFFEADGQTPEEWYEKKEVYDRIYELLEQEPERVQRIVTMRLQGFSFYEIGASVGVSESSARVMDFRTKAKIRKQLKKEGYFGE